MKATFLEFCEAIAERYYYREGEARDVAKDRLSWGILIFGLGLYGGLTLILFASFASR